MTKSLPVLLLLSHTRWLKSVAISAIDHVEIMWQPLRLGRNTYVESLENESY